jgi:hypothetical protein
VTGYPVVPALFILAALVLLVFSFMDQPRESIAGALVISVRRAGALPFSTQQTCGQ